MCFIALLLIPSLLPSVLSDDSGGPITDPNGTPIDTFVGFGRDNLGFGESKLGFGKHFKKKIPGRFTSGTSGLVHTESELNPSSSYGSGNTLVHPETGFSPSNSIGFGTNNLVHAESGLTSSNFGVAANSLVHAENGFIPNNFGFGTNSVVHGTGGIKNGGGFGRGGKQIHYGDFAHKGDSAHKGDFAHKGGFGHEDHFVSPKYEFSYGVNDPYYGTNFGHSEKRDGYNAQGQYYVHLPDGRFLRVSYYTDEWGYHPTLTYEGEAVYPVPIKGYGHGAGFKDNIL